jgi:hypothetical protein
MIIFTTWFCNYFPEDTLHPSYNKHIATVVESAVVLSVLKSMIAEARDVIPKARELEKCWRGG